MEIKEVKLKDICIDMHQGINTVADKVEYKDNGFPIIQSKNITSNYLDLDDVRYLDEDDYLKYKDKYNPKIGDILVCNIGTIGTSLVLKEDIEFLIAWNLFKLKINTDLYNSSYIKYYLDRLKSMDYFDRLTTGGTVKFINKAKMGDIVVPVFSLETQNKIVEVLDKAQELIDKRKEQIDALDELVKSRFIEMFGDPVKNPKEWNKVNIGSKFEIKTGATPSRKENTYWENGTIPWVKTTELKEVIINETEEYITQDGYDNSSVNLLPKETLLIAMYGQGKTRGMTGKLGIEATTNQACAAILPNSEENMDFVWYQLKLSYEDLRSLGRGGSQPNLNTNLIKSYELIFPPMKLQNQFVDFVNQVNKLKSQMETSLKELDDNFNSLMQKAFKGELF